MGTVFVSKQAKSVSDGLTKLSAQASFKFEILYMDNNGVDHGFLRKPNGKITLIDVTKDPCTLRCTPSTTAARSAEISRPPVLRSDGMRVLVPNHPFCVIADFSNRAHCADPR